MRKYNAHLESSGLRPEGGREDEPGVSVVTVENRPPWGPDVFFFIDPGSMSGTGPAIAKAARSQADADYMVDAGFRELDMTLLSRGSRPTCVIQTDPVAGNTAASATSTASAAHVSTRKAEIVPLPPTLPKCDTKRDAPTAAEQVVGWMEASVMVAGTQYTPMWRWTKQSRAFALCGWTKPTRQEFGRRIQMYLMVRTGDVTPGQIDLSYSALRAAALQACKDGAVEKLATDKEEDTADWFDTAAAMAEKTLGRT